MSDTPRTCTCHPDDNPPVPCPGKRAYHECMQAALAAAQRRVRELEAGLRDVMELAYRLPDEMIDGENGREEYAAIMEKARLTLLGDKHRS